MIQQQPFSNKRIVVTRNAEGSSRLGERLRLLGAEVIELPLIKIDYAPDAEKADEVFEEFGQYEWLVFTSRNGVKYFFKAFFHKFDDIRSLGFIRIAAVGEGTTEALREYMLKPDFVPPQATAESLGLSLSQDMTLDNLRFLVITGNRNREDLVKQLTEERAIVDTLQVYSTGLTDLSNSEPAGDFCKRGADAVVFASGSAVESFGKQAQHLQLSSSAKVPVLCSFGPTTSEHMRKAGIPIAVEASEPGIDGMVAALISYFSNT